MVGTTVEHQRGEPFFQTIPVPANRCLVVDAGIVASKRHLVYGFVQADITKAHELCREKNLSLTAYLAACLARAVHQDPMVQAYLCKGKKKFVIFEDVDVATMIEAREGDVAIPHVLRKAQTRTVADLSQEIRSIQENPQQSPQQTSNLAKWAPCIPRWLRLLAFHILMHRSHPKERKNKMGTVMLTSIGMFGSKGRGGFPLSYLPLHTLGVTVGGIEERRPTYVWNDDNGEYKLEPREFVCLTIAFDHDVVDGAPGARFVKRLVDQIETSAYMPAVMFEDEDTSS